ncbi:hypothetical protein [Rhizobium leguminosarum]|uniref:hypothetical protein n=1 Tax=Rhizobium leguminosarum TaxID=384 RepID=UPI001C9888C5|nr:hypothetical protein [Rhizobium leguminosarum]MBY5439072.1 hypothetical protein [Rhizobium leguminosarum]
MAKEAISYLGDYPADLIWEVGGDALVDSFKARITGADNNKNGRDFELSYGIARTLEEIALLVDLLRQGVPIGDLDGYCFWDRPISLVDDYYISGYLEHSFTQLKLGSFTHDEIVKPISVQRTLDEKIELNVQYSAILGDPTRKEALDDFLVRQEITDVAVGVFNFELEFHDLLDGNSSLGTALEGITGSTKRTDQETAYNVFFVQYWRTRHLETFQNFLDKSAAKAVDFIPKFRSPDGYHHLSHLIEQGCPGCSAVFVGDLLRLKYNGYLRTFIVPSDDDFYRTVLMLDGSEFTFDELELDLEISRWQRPVR